MKSLLYAAMGTGLLVSAVSAQSQMHEIMPKARNHGNNLNISMQGDAESCADLKVTSSNGQVAQAAERFELSRGEASTIELNAGERGVVKVKGWKQPGYLVEVCKTAVSEDRATAEQAVRAIVVARSAGRFSYTGPATDNANWQAYFIIHAPDNASLDLETKNAPVSVVDVKGNIKVRATNGPLSIHGSTGNIDAQTENGPISFDGDSGEVHLHANNGPISVRLQKELWNGAVLEARTVNGPMSLSLPAVFQSGLRMEASGNAPMSCRHDVCAHAVNTRSSDHRVMQINGSNETVRISTENGPVSVSATRQAKM